MLDGNPSHSPLEQRTMRLETAVRKLDTLIEKYENDPDEDTWKEMAVFAEDDIGMNMFALGVDVKSQEELHETLNVVYAKLVRDAAYDVLRTVRETGRDLFLRKDEDDPA